MNKALVMTTSQRLFHDVVNFAGAFFVGVVVTGIVYEQIVWKRPVKITPQVQLDCKPKPGEAMLIRHNTDGEITCSRLLEKPLGDVGKVPSHFLQPIWRIM